MTSAFDGLPGRAVSVRDVKVHQEKVLGKKSTSQEDGAAEDHQAWLSREVYCIQGIPVDALTMEEVVAEIQLAKKERKRLFLSTPNLNFLVTARSDEEFRDTLIESDLCVADGMPVVWIARLLGIPEVKRIAGADLLPNLIEDRKGREEVITVAFFGGPEGAGAAACEMLNGSLGGVSCSGWVNPGFKPLEALCEESVIDDVNSIEADFLVVALGARKGQLWLRRNGSRLTAPVRSHLGAVVNFLAGKVRRAPEPMRMLGLEWLWRIKEEPSLWRRYLRDGVAFLWILASDVIPLAILLSRITREAKGNPFGIEMEEVGDVVLAKCGGIATLADRPMVGEVFSNLAACERDVVLDLDRMRGADPSFFGILMLLSRKVSGTGRRLTISANSRRMQRCFKWHGMEFMLSRHQIARSKRLSGCAIESGPSS